MKRLHCRVLLIVASTAFLALSGCNDDQSTSHAAATGPHQKTADEIREQEESKPPYVGMTKSQALARYGEPRSKTVTDQGEQWTYVLNFGKMMGNALIPFNFKQPTPRIGVLTFGPNGKVKEFRWDAEADNN